MAKLATKVILGKRLKEMGYTTGLIPPKNGVYVKVPVFSFNKLRKVDAILGPEMKSTGEVMGKDTTLEKALYKGLIASGAKVPLSGSVLFTVADKDKAEALELASRFEQIGYSIYGTEGTAQYFNANGISTTMVNKIGESKKDNLLNLIQNGHIQFVVNTFTNGKSTFKDGHK